MTKKLRLLLIAVFAFIACVCLLAGCNLKPSLDDVIEDTNKKGAVVNVTYFANEGTFTGEKKVRNVLFPVDGRAINIGKDKIDKGDIKISCADIKLELAGWFEAKTDANGNPLYEDGTPYEFNYDISDYDSTKNIQHVGEDGGEPFNFSTKLEKGKHYYLVAQWRKVKTVNVVLAGEVSTLKATLNGETKEFKAGDVINEIVYESNGLIPIQQDALPGYNVSNASFIAFYHNDTCNKEELFKDDEWPIKYEDHKDDPDDEPYTIYAKYLEGSWDVVKNTNNLTRMFSNATSADKHYFILNDIECNPTGNKPLEVAALSGTEGFACEIRGNGCTISNLKVVQTFRANQKNCASFLGEIKDSAKISDLIFENLVQDYTINSDAKVKDGIYFAFMSVADGAKLEGVVLNGTMAVKIGTNGYVKNMQGGATDNWKFGGYDNDEYTGGITVNATVSVTNS